ncbi:hypothetical protein Nepgr_033112 [Nepenthes gracilis]|uniref:Uncharacterized protein n=1 Tax=Nepenthes gracilis TaxID=150966 RepID=A0AAD3TLA9_NEPGR|nr:hypothetical protein Nepgr_033112 [Nepenthes gracilis]
MHPISPSTHPEGARHQNTKELLNVTEKKESQCSYRPSEEIENSFKTNSHPILRNHSKIQTDEHPSIQGDGASYNMVKSRHRNPILSTRPHRNLALDHNSQKVQRPIPSKASTHRAKASISRDTNSRSTDHHL